MKIGTQWQAGSGQGGPSPIISDNSTRCRTPLVRNFKQADVPPQHGGTPLRALAESPGLWVGMLGRLRACFGVTAISFGVMPLNPRNLRLLVGC